MALAPSLTSASIVGFPRESKICRPLISRIALMLPPQAAEKDQHSTRPAQARQDAPFPNLRSRLDKILNGDPAASPLGGAHRLGAPYSSHRAPQRVRLRYLRRLRSRWNVILTNWISHNTQHALAQG